MTKYILISDSTPKRRYNIPVLSGSAYIGQLYDATNEQLLHDRFLWKGDISVSEANITSVEADTYFEENINNRLDHMGVGAGLRISFNTGLYGVSVSKL